MNFCNFQASLKCGCYPAGLQQLSHSNFPLCSPQGISCYRSLLSPSCPLNSHLRNYSLPSMSCKIPCHGLYSDVEHEAAGETIGLDTPGMAQLMQEYQAYKRGNLHDPVPYLKGWPFHNLHLLKPTSGVEPELKLHVVNIFFNTPTVDQITKDAKTNIMTQISVIGGTLGLFTGFSIMSGFEILYFVVRIALGMLEKPKETRKDLKGR